MGKQKTKTKKNNSIKKRPKNISRKPKKEERNKKYAFLVITTHGAHERSLPHFKLPYDIVSFQSAPLGYPNYRIGDKNICDTNYNNIINKIKGILRLRKSSITLNKRINLSLENIMLQLHKIIKKTNVLPENLEEYNRGFSVSHKKRFQIYESKKGEPFLDKYYSYEKSESPSSENVDSKSDNKICLIYLDEYNQVVEEDLNIIMDHNENGIRGFSLESIMKYIKQTYSEPQIKFDKLFLLDMACDVVWSNRNNMAEENPNARNIISSRRSIIKSATNLNNKRFSLNRKTRNYKSKS